MTELATIQHDDAVATLTLNRPDARNAMSIDLLGALHARVDGLRADPPTVLVITGAGRAFCAGMDLKQVLGDHDAGSTLLGSLADLAIKLRKLPSVTVASVNGAAIGGGCGLATVCDFAVTHADAKLGFPEVDLGVCPAVVAPWLVKKIGAGPARAMLLQGGLISGAEAHERRLVSHLAPDRDGLIEATDALVHTLASGGTDALRATKDLLNRLDGSLDEQIARDAAALSARVLASEQAQASLRARFGADGSARR